MQVGVPKEIKEQEYRVGLTPGGVRELINRGHQIWVESNAGAEIGFTNDAYKSAGAKIVDTPDEIFAKAELIVKVKEPQPIEYTKLRNNQILFTYLHLAADPKQTDALVASGCSAMAYETVTDLNGALPLLTPMSEVAGRLSVQAGANCLEKKNGGRGVLLGGIAGAPAGKVVVLGGGIVGTQALNVALGMGAQVTVVDKSLKRLRELETIFAGRLTTVYPNQDTLEKYLSAADLVIGAILVPGAAAPKVVSRDMVKKMKPGSVIVDIAIDQGGCVETSRVTTHLNPTFVEEGVLHYCVANIPASVPHTATIALSNATLPFVISLAEHGLHKACLQDPHLLRGLNVHQGHITHEAVASALGRQYEAAESALRM